MNHRIRNAILGAAVADAAALGFHWLYDQDRISTLAPHSPEFHAHSLQDYEGVMGYFAHAKKQTGDFSQYGEQMMTMLRSLVASGNAYDKTHYEAHFKEFFGYGGDYVGYIDHPTRDTLNNLAQAERTAIVRAEAIPFKGAATMKHRLVTKVLAEAKQHTGEQLRARVEQAVRTTDDDDYLVSHAMKMLEEWEQVSGFNGADDEQLPAISKLPPLVAVYAGQATLKDIVESAVRVTNNTDLAVKVAQSAATMLDVVIQGAAPAAGVAAALQDADPAVSALIDSALSMSSDTTPAVTRKLGLACELEYGLPSIVHNVSTSSSYSQAIRQNIFAGGDSCGRSIMLGAIMGAHFGLGGDAGIPEPWIDKLNQKQQLEQLLDHIAS